MGDGPGIVFLGTAWVLRKEGHVKMELLLNRLKPRAQATANIVASFIGMAISLALIWYGTLVTIDHFQRSMRFPTVLETPITPILAVIPVGSFLLFIQFLRRTYSYAERWRDVGRSETKDIEKTLSY